jgi:hypothetical protein
MENNIAEFVAKTFGNNSTTPFRVYNPNLLKPTEQIRIKSIEKAEKYTIVEFQYKASLVNARGGFINIRSGCYIQPVQTTKRMVLWKAFGIPTAPQKLYLSANCGYQCFSLLFAALPKKVTSINFIESSLPGYHIKFQDVDFSNWWTIPHAIDFPISSN